MFEQNPNPSQPPANLPFGQPQSPFLPPQPASATQPIPQVFPASQPAPTGQAAPVEDMFSATDRPAAPAGYAERAALPAGYQPGPQISDADLFGGGGTSWGKVITVIIIILVVAGLIGVAVWGFNYFSSLKKQEAAPPAVQEASTPVAASPAATTSAAETAATETPTASTTAITEANQDTDGDGLADEEEKVLGSDPNKADSDADGLTDWAEAKIYKTDLLNPDTDGDSYQDGNEVINGYDPLKPGSARLYEVPKAAATQ